MTLEEKTKKVSKDGKEVTIVISVLTNEEARQLFPYRPFSKYAESRFGGNTLVDDFALLLNGDAEKCKMCRAPAYREYLSNGVCPDCDGRSEYNGKNPRVK
jgi:hypothetical protein